MDLIKPIHNSKSSSSSIQRAYEWKSLSELSIVKAGVPQGSIFSYTDKWSSVNPKFISPFQRSISGFSVFWWHKSHLPWIVLLSTRPLTMSRSFYWACFIPIAIQQKYKWCNFNHRKLQSFRTILNLGCLLEKFV